MCYCCYDFRKKNNNNMSITITDSIAIKILADKTILTGVGNELHYYHNKDSEKSISGNGTLRKRVLSVKLSNKVHGIALGNEHILVYGEKEFVLLTKQQEAFNELYRGQLSDWIIAAKFLATNNEFVLLTAHSVVLRCTYCRKSDEFRLIERSSCTDKSTLYCGSLYGDSWQTLLVLGGNAFGELLLWQPTSAKQAPLLHRIPAHNGVIFSIVYAANLQLLTTTSDDRSIRFWSVQIKENDWASATLKPLASGYGHTARVFQAQIIEYGDEPYVLSVGEDSFVCLWRCNGELLYKRRQQFGAVIWNLDYDNELQIVYTVGSTGNCIPYSLADMLECTSTKTLPALSEGYVAKIKFLDENLLIGVSNSNQLLYKDLTTDSNWLVVDQFEPFKCTVLAVQETAIVLCGFRRLVVYDFAVMDAVEKQQRFTKRLDVTILKTIIRSFHFLSGDRYLLSDEQGNCVLLHSPDAGATSPMKTYSLTLPQCKERWLTSALYLSDDYLLVSNRQGNMMLYQLKPSLGSYELLDVLKHPHGNLGATMLNLVDSSDERLVVQSAGHDGALKYIAVDRLAGKLKIIQRAAVPVSWVEAILDEDNLLLGFNDNHFVVWSQEKDFLHQVPCGGGHRCWDYCLAKKGMLQVAFIRNKQVLMHKLQLHKSFEGTSKQLQLPAHNSWHVKACNVAKLIAVEAERGPEFYMISAGEDNLVKISCYNANDKDFKQVKELHMHISNIRALAVCEKTSGEYLIFSAGGRAQLCISKFQIERGSACFVEELCSYMLTDKASHKSEYNLDPETRIMSLDILPNELMGEDSGYRIYMGCSDGYVRCFLWNSKNNEILHRHELFIGKCLLQMRVVADGAYILIAATDGCVQFYDQQLEHLHFQIQQHASGINGLDFSIENDCSRLHLLTGGDDQAVAYSCLQLKPSLALLHSWQLPGLHTAQVTAACLARDFETRELYGYTSGVDQQVYKLSLRDGSIMQQYSAPIADVKGLCLDSKGNCYLYGCGLQIFSFSS